MQADEIVVIVITSTLMLACFASWVCNSDVDDTTTISTDAETIAIEMGETG